MITLVLTDPLAEEIEVASRGADETAGVVLVSLLGDAADVRLLAREIHWVPEEAYERRTSFSLSITSDGYVAALARAGEIGAIPLWFHTHPGPTADPTPSAHDVKVDSQLSEVFRIRAGVSVYGSLIVSPRQGGIAFTGRLEMGDVERSINRVWRVGDRFTLTR